MPGKSLSLIRLVWFGAKSLVGCVLKCYSNWPMHHFSSFGRPSLLQRHSASSCWLNRFELAVPAFHVPMSLAALSSLEFLIRPNAPFLLIRTAILSASLFVRALSAFIASVSCFFFMPLSLFVGFLIRRASSHFPLLHSASRASCQHDPAILGAPRGRHC